MSWRILQGTEKKIIQVTPQPLENLAGLEKTSERRWPEPPPGKNRLLSGQSPEDGVSLPYLLETSVCNLSSPFCPALSPRRGTGSVPTPEI